MKRMDAQDFVSFLHSVDRLADMELYFGFGLALPVYAFPLPHSSLFEQESYLHSYTALEVIQFVYNVSSAQQDRLHRASSFEDGLLNDLGNNKYIGTISD